VEDCSARYGGFRHSRSNAPRSTRSDLDTAPLKPRLDPRSMEMLRFLKVVLRPATMLRNTSTLLLRDGRSVG
jgi:hypothetical protein